MLTKELTYGVLLALMTGNCRHKMPEPVFGNFPLEVGAIFSKSCAVSGCHNEKSKMAAGGLSLSSWEGMFNIENSNAVAIPYSAGQSPIFFFANTFADLGPVNTPTMPVGSNPLCREEVLTIKNWLRNGAPSAEGRIMYADDPDRVKVYVLNYSCSNVAVLDVASGKVIRYITLQGNDPGDKAEIIRSSANREFWYVLFASGILLKYDATEDVLVGSLNLGKGSWRDLFLAAKEPVAIVTSYAGYSDHSGGQISMVNTESMQVFRRFDSLYFPEGTIADESLRYIYASCNTGNFIYKISNFPTQGSAFNKIPLTNEDFDFEVTQIRPGSLSLSDDNRLLVLCEKSNELKVINLANEKLEQTIKIGNRPEELVCIPEKPVVAISCSEDRTDNGIGKGHVYLVNTQNGEIQKKWYTGYQPKGLALDKKNDRIYVANKNADPVGADKPHHYTECLGNNGYIKLIDLKNMEVIKGFKTEVSVNPYSLTLR